MFVMLYCLFLTIFLLFCVLYYEHQINISKRLPVPVTILQSADILLVFFFPSYKTNLRCTVLRPCYVVCMNASMSGGNLSRSWLSSIHESHKRLQDEQHSQAQMSPIYDDAFTSKTGLGRRRSIGCKKQVSGLGFLL